MRIIAIIYLGSGVNPPDSVTTEQVEVYADEIQKAGAAVEQCTEALKALTLEQYERLASEEIEELDTSATMVAVPPVRKQDLPVIPIWQTDYG